MEFIVIQCFNSDIHSNVLTPMSTKVTSNRSWIVVLEYQNAFSNKCNYKYISD